MTTTEVDDSLGLTFSARPWDPRPHREKNLKVMVIFPGIEPANLTSCAEPILKALSIPGRDYTKQPARRIRVARHLPSKEGVSVEDAWLAACRDFKADIVVIRKSDVVYAEKAIMAGYTFIFQDADGTFREVSPQ